VLARALRTLFILLVASCFSAARADEVTFPDLSEAVAGVDGVTYLDLVRQVVPDIAAGDGGYQGHKVIDVRHIGGEAMQSPPPDTISLFNVAALPVRSDGKERLLLLLDLGQGADSAEGFAVLALYSLVGLPTLVDAANVGYDQSTYFFGQGRLSLGEGKDVVLTMSTHFNSNQAYVTTAMILARNDRLQLVDTVSTFSDKSCSFEHDQMPDFRAGDRDGRTYSDIVATVTETTKPTAEACSGEEKPKEETRKITVAYRWDEASSRFVAGSDAFEVLAKENETRF
jgi:hypothetical protein